MQSENDTVWSTAVELAGLWKLESARANLEITLKQTDSRRVRKYAAINSPNRYGRRTDAEILR